MTNEELLKEKLANPPVMSMAIDHTDLYRQMCAIMEDALAYINKLEEYKRKRQRLVTWAQYDDDNVGLHWGTYGEASYALEAYGGYIYRIERDEDGSNPTIELVETGGKDE